ncbi:putative reverse transcriptase [Wolbachia endosymbiont of Culex quinquefasciatus JHB]|uniref:group II intron reverse transcriptase/maturase n=1 Tax=unclassified Wolbachia TaxID=2640676 RepID=UPI0001761D04|nr:MULTISPECIES: group II intron reverse transcriptase/maturase [unclassified Wolbachia]EEB55872.1 putative reverse transcriptase [Wolbachia endosymbiont of Culex quinquefasciatus JHB]EEB56358.1 putative reverse transcriptase [Wolbachia endosymbiont of Culex quinquefasciatus JHB]CAQ54277.1 Putative reverse transcriptase [Wolbachia endosymbiont of Culex quinquefasciatus Pel]CAQ55084.1 Putative reverse transcriptase [Wolbachia endosymbiont of Culex quinquefasciatus Pel]CQD11374.1 Putative revers
MNKTKSFDIPKQLIWRAYKQVSKNKGAAGVDEVSITKFEENLKDNLYKLWNRMSSGSYFPEPVKAVAIPKDTGGQRILCVPSVFDRIAQTAATMYLEPLVEPKFHEDSYGYRPNKSALDAVYTARKRCWKNDWTVDLDISGFFDNLDHDLALQAIKKHTDCKWVILYVERWMKAPIQQADGSRVTRDKGVPQGGSISPIISSIFMHHAFDMWMKQNYPTVPFERYVDDAIVHCRTKRQAGFMKVMIEERLAKCKLKLHPEKTQIVYSKDDDRKEQFPKQSFDFLGYTFRPRVAKNKMRNYFISFLPAISNKAKKKIKKTIKSWRIHRITWTTLEEISKKIDPIVRGWFQYYGRFYKSEMYPSLRNIERYLIRWVRTKYKKLRDHGRLAKQFLGKVRKRSPSIFYHWTLGLGSKG